MLNSLVLMIVAILILIIIMAAQFINGDIYYGLCSLSVLLFWVSSIMLEIKEDKEWEDN
jgi:hypothetical protein